MWRANIMARGNPSYRNLHMTATDMAIAGFLRACAARAWGRSRVRDMTTRAGAWPPSRRVVSRGSSRRTVCPPTTTASDRARQSNTRCRDSAELTHAACPADVAILPSSVIAYFSTPSGLPVRARCSSACDPAVFAHLRCSRPCTGGFGIFSSCNKFYAVGVAGRGANNQCFYPAYMDTTARMLAARFWQDTHGTKHIPPGVHRTCGVTPGRAIPCKAGR